jgi:hypothetical protein
MRDRSQNEEIFLGNEADVEASVLQSLLIFPIPSEGVPYSVNVFPFVFSTATSATSSGYLPLGEFSMRNTALSLSQVQETRQLPEEGLVRDSQISRMPDNFRLPFEPDTNTIEQVDLTLVRRETLPADCMELLRFWIVSHSQPLCRAWVSSNHVSLLQEQL